MAASTDDEVDFLRLSVVSARAAAEELSTGSQLLIERIAELSGQVADLRIALASKESECESWRTRCDAATVALRSKSAALTHLLAPHTTTPRPSHATDCGDADATVLTWRRRDGD